MAGQNISPKDAGRRKAPVSKHDIRMMDTMRRRQVMGCVDIADHGRTTRHPQHPCHHPWPEVGQQFAAAARTHDQEVGLRVVHHTNDFLRRFSLADQTLGLDGQPGVAVHHLFEGIELAFGGAGNPFFSLP